LPYRLTIKLRIAVLLALAILLFCALGAVGMMRLQSIQQQLRYIDEVSLNTIDLSRRMNAELIEMRLRVVRHKAANALPSKLQAEQELRKHADSLLGLIDLYQKLPVSEAQRASVQSLRPLVAEYLSAAEPILALSRQMDPNHPPPNADPRSAAVAKQVDATVNQIVNESRAGATAMRQDAELSYDHACLVLGGTIAAGALLELCVGLLLMRSISRSLSEAHRAMTVVADDLDFTRRANLRGNDELSETFVAFDRVIERLQSSFKDLERSVVGVKNASGEMNRSAVALDSSSSSSAAASASMAATIEQLTVSIGQVGDRAGDASQMTQDAGQLARDGEQAILATVGRIQQTVATVEQSALGVSQLRDQAALIGKVTNVIKDIADQTNLLALNAAIEAARAGEQGRGFAVVADEVRKLASNTASATLEIDQMVLAVQQEATRAVKRIDMVVRDVTESAEGATQAGEAIVQIRGRTEAVSALVAEIAAAIHQQAAAGAEVARQVERIAASSEENHALAGSAAVSAQALDKLSSSMHEAMACYRL
jgi:methyl-accepting chemotaxis protein